MMATARAPLWAVSPVAPAGETGERIIPFDHSFQFRLSGERQRVHRTTVTVSVEASFSAVSIGYGVVPDVSPIIFGPSPPAPGLTGAGLRSPRMRIRDINLGDLMDVLQTALANSPDAPKGVPLLEAVLRNGIKLNSAFASLGLLDNGNALLDQASLQQLFQVVSAPSQDLQFLYALYDEGSGREFQSEPLLNIAGLGAPDGKRPFRYFSRPIRFAPRSTIRMDVTELTDFRGELHVSLHGYKALGATVVPTGERSRPARRRGR